MAVNTETIINNITQAVYYAVSWAGVEYALAKTVLDTATEAVTETLAPTASSFIGGRITVMALRGLNSALSFGLQTSFLRSPSSPAPV